MANRKDITGQRFGKLTVLDFTIQGPSRKQAAFWRCQCDCGAITYAEAYSLTNGTRKSCGCLRREGLHRTHGMEGTTEYNIWLHIKQRCFNPSNAAYRNYGGRGITMDPEWAQSFEAFYRDMGPRPPHHSIDRIDNNKGYSKENCRWATARQQGNNQRKTHFITYNGQTQSLSRWADSLGLAESTLRNRVARWGVERAFSSPVRILRNSKRTHHGNSPAALMAHAATSECSDS